MTKSCFAFSLTGLAASSRRGLLLGSALTAAAPAAAQTFVGNDFSTGSSLLGALQTDGNSDKFPPFVILQEYSPSGPTTSGAIFGSAGTVNDVTFYGGGNYDFTVYALALDSRNAAQNELTFSVVGDETFKGDAATLGAQNLAASFSVGAGDYLAFAGIGPWYPQAPNNAVGSDATYASSSEPQTFPTSFTAIPPTAGQTFTVGAHSDAGATYEIVPNSFTNQGRSYGIGVDYTPSAVVPQQVLLNSASLGRTNLSWTNQDGQSNWVDSTGALTGPPQEGKDVNLNNRTGTNANGSTVMTFDAATDPKINSLTIDSNAGGQLVELAQSANTLTAGSETIGTTGPAEHLQTGGVNNVTNALTLNGYGTYDLRGGTLNAGTITVGGAGAFYFDGGTAKYMTFNQTGGTVASGTAASLASVSLLAYGNGTEIVSAAGSLTAPSTPGVLPTISGGAIFNQSGGTNDAGALTLGLNGGVGVYNLSGGALNAASETIGGKASVALFNQTGGINVDNGEVKGGTPVVVGGGSFYELSGGSSELNATALQIKANGVFNQSGGLVEAGRVQLFASGSYMLAGGKLLTSGDEEIFGAFMQSGGSTNGPSGNLPKPPASPNQSIGLTIRNGGVYDLQGGILELNTAVNAGGTFRFDDGQNLGTFTLNGGTVTAAHAETVQTPFFQLGGSNTTTKLAVASPEGANGTYDLRGGTLNAGTITVGGAGAFYFDGGTAKYMTFNQTGGTVASGTAASLASVSLLAYGNGTEIVSAAGSLTAPSTPGVLPTISGGAIFNQSGGTNDAGALTLGLNGGVGVYNLSGGALNAASETIGGKASVALFNQTGGINVDNGEVKGGTPVVVGGGSFYELSGGSSELNATALQIKANGVFNQSGGLVEAGRVQLFASGSYMLAGGKLLTSGDEEIFGAFMQSGGSTNGPSGNLPKPPASPNQSIGLTIGNGGVYDLQGGILELNTAVNAGGTFRFDDGQNLGTFTLNGGTVTAAHAETVQTPFFQLGGSNTTNTLTIANGASIGLSGSYDLRGGTLSAGTIKVNGGSFAETGGQATVTGAANNSGGVLTIGAGTTFSVGGAYTNSGLTLLEGGTLQASGGIDADGGVIGGTGTMIGVVTVSGGIVQVGASPDAIHIEGVYTQSGGRITFEVDPDGKGGFLESSLVFDPGDFVSITGTKIVFDFLNGANPLAFFDSGAFNLDEFFEESDASLFSKDFNLVSLFADDTFATNMRGFGIAGFGTDGSVDLVGTSAVPEPSTWAMMLLGFAGLGFAGWRASRRTVAFCGAGPRRAAA